MNEMPALIKQARLVEKIQTKTIFERFFFSFARTFFILFIAAFLNVVLFDISCTK
jgi:hypothetical protein